MLNDMMKGITDMIGQDATGSLFHAVFGLVILIVGLFVVKVVASLISRLLMKVPVLYSQKDGVVTDYASPMSSLIKAVLTIFLLMIVLQYFGLTDVLAPLKEMVSELMGVIPNIIGAGVIAYAGWIIAKIVADLVASALNRFDEQIQQRTGNNDIKVSPFGRSVVMAAILLPIFVTALGVLDIPAISDPASNMLGKLMSAIPNIIGAAIILIVTYLVTRFVVNILQSILQGMQIDQVPQKIGASSLFTESFTLSRFIGISIMFFAMLSASTAAVNLLGIEIISTIFARVIEFGGGILVGGVILVIGNFLSMLAYDKLTVGAGSGVANIARFAILGLVLAMGLKAMGLADHIVNMAFGFTLGSVAIAVAIAFGLGGKDAARTVSSAWVEKLKK